MIIQFITAVVVFYLVIRLAQKYKRREINSKEAFLWGMLWFSVFFFVLYPKFADSVASKIGLKTAMGIDLVVYIAVTLAFYLIFRISVHMERVERDITKITRHIALKEDDKK